MQHWIELNMTPGIGPRVAAKLLERFGSAERVLCALRAELEPMKLPPETIESIIKREKREAAEVEIDKVRAAGGDVMIVDDGSYPALLREISDPPITLYVKGAWELCVGQPCVAIVGSRRCSTYGVNTAQMLSRELASHGVTIVSGLARGIDAAAHRGAMEAGGRTVAVMGTGLDDIYPRDHEKLAAQILETGGALVTEFPLGTPPIPPNFPYRNRIISGLSLGTVLVEATERSGSLITARLAMEQNREVFAVPGNITSRTSFGTNYLIKGAGAKLVQQWQDIAQELPPEIAARILPPELGESDSSPDTPPEAEQREPANLSEHERAVWDLLSPDDQKHIDSLMLESKLTIAELTAALLGLEMRDAVRRLPGNSYVKKL
ncbi:MAG: DNA-processing protein DprA [Pyrinomonadaceae bacterium MAG19_C2-C3]|nr:DNA-processing protein DprA [Pyrinomonadaceae bacterium MAG19_C2-C3]